MARMPDDDKKGTDIVAAIQQMLGGAEKAFAPAQPGGIAAPGQVAPGPQPNIAFNPGGSPGGPLQHAPAPPARRAPMTGGESLQYQGNRNAQTNQGMVSLGNSLSGLFSEAGKREHDKKSAMAENYMLQISGLLASGDPEDKKLAMMF